MQEVIENGRLVWRLVQDARVPGWVKIGIPLLVALYFIFPIDFIPDFIPGLGQLDDIGVVLAGMSLMIRFAPSHIVAEHRRALGYHTDGGDAQARPSTSWPPPSANRRGAGAEQESGSIEAEYRVIPSERER